MKPDWQSYLNKLYARIEDEDERRRRLVDALLLVTAGTTAVAMLLALIVEALDIIEEPFSPIYVSGAIVLAGSLTLYVLNRRISPLATGIVLVGLFFLGIVPFERLDYLIEGRSTYLWMLPIVLSSVLIRSWASFVVATLTAVVYAYLQLNWQHEPLPNIITLLGFYFVAFVMWLATGSLERALQELIRVNRELDKRVEERTQALQALNQELIRRNEDLEAFAHTVAHDLKGPLASLLGFSEALQDNLGHMSQETLFNYLNLIGRSARKLTNIVDELLLLSSFSKVEVLSRPVAMGSVVGAALERLRDTIQQRKAEFVIQASWPAAYGYGPWLEEVWVNYISNALKYGGTPPRIVLGATRQQDGMVRFWVKDNGYGLTEEEQRRLFVPFTRLANVRAQGYGLGLSITRRIVERLGGQVGVESEPGKGSTFFFTLPAAPEDEERRNGSAQPQLSDQGTGM